MADISIQNVRKIYPGGVEAIPGLSLDIADGELCVLVGPSGCGKSTLLRMVAGLEEVTSGDVNIGARRVNDLEPAERDIAMVFQSYALYPHMTVFDNMAYGLRNRAIPREEVRTRVEEAATTLGLRDFLTRRPRQLSGGQRQRVAMGRAIVRDPQVFLFDEPLSNLDAKLRIQTRVEIRALQQRVATTAIYVTHDQLEAMTLADRLVVMNGGRIEQMGRPIDIYDRPATVFVASFIGSPPMNLLAGRAVGAAVELPGGARIPAPVGAMGEVTVGLRPEALQPSADGLLAVEVRVVEQLGAALNVHGVLRGTDSAIIASIPCGPVPSVGETMHLSTALTPHLFDATTGVRIE